jgi:poly-gamma-glutamate synthesis protein (capsule biosynthesis protein)
MVDLGTMAGEAVSIFLAGDVMTGRAVDQIQAERSDPTLREPYLKDARDYVRLSERVSGPVPAPVAPAYIWGEGLEVIQAAKPAAAIVNLETSATTSDDFWEGKEIHYRMHPANVGCLTAARIDVCNLANNHVLDFGRAGLLETIEVLRAAGIQTVGAGADIQEARAPARVPTGAGGAVVVFGLGDSSSGVPYGWGAGPWRAGINALASLSPQNADAVAEPIGRAKAPGDIAVASIHWGGNWGFDVPLDEVAFAHRLIDRGVDLVHGHSSHNVRPAEIYKDRLILYGCGDLINDYEGIRGYEEWRGDLGLMYFATLSCSDGALVGLRMVPVKARKMSLVRAVPADVAWLAATLGRAGRPLGTRVEIEDDGTLALVRRRDGGGGRPRASRPVLVR